jgi:hypothetical protein
MPHSSSKVKKTHIKDPLGVMTFEYNLSASVQQSSSYLQLHSMERFFACTHIYSLTQTLHITGVLAEADIPGAKSNVVYS